MTILWYDTREPTEQYRCVAYEGLLPALRGLRHRVLGCSVQCDALVRLQGPGTRWHPAAARASNTSARWAQGISFRYVTKHLRSHTLRRGYLRMAARRPWSQLVSELSL